LTVSSSAGSMELSLQLSIKAINRNGKTENAEYFFIILPKILVT